MKNISGKIIGISGLKTVKVLVFKIKKIKKYNKNYRMKKTYLVHCNFKIIKIGDNVKIKNTKKISKLKNYKIISIIK